MLLILMLLHGLTILQFPNSQVIRYLGSCRICGIQRKGKGGVLGFKVPNGVDL